MPSICASTRSGGLVTGCESGWWRPLKISHRKKYVQIESKVTSRSPASRWGVRAVGGSRHRSTSLRRSWGILRGRFRSISPNSTEPLLFCPAKWYDGLLYPSEEEIDLVYVQSEASSNQKEC